MGRHRRGKVENALIAEVLVDAARHRRPLGGMRGKPTLAWPPTRRRMKTRWRNWGRSVINTVTTADLVAECTPSGPPSRSTQAPLASLTPTPSPSGDSQYFSSEWPRPTLHPEVEFPTRPIPVLMSPELALIAEERKVESMLLLAPGTVTKTRRELEQTLREGKTLWPRPIL